MRKVREWLPDWYAMLNEEQIARAGLTDIMECEVGSAPDAVDLVALRIDNMRMWLDGIKPGLPLEYRLGLGC